MSGTPTTSVDDVYQNGWSLFSRTMATAALVLLGLEISVAGSNKLGLLRAAGNLLQVHLANEDPVAGIQFTFNSRGGTALGSFSAASRLYNAGWNVFQFRRNDSTLSVLLLAPFRTSLEAGDGSIGDVGVYVRDQIPDSVRIALSGVGLCDVNARVLPVSTAEVTWSLREEDPQARPSVTLDQNYPNPFPAGGGSAFGGNPATTISYRLEQPAHVSLAVFDILGRQVKTLVDDSQAMGRHNAVWRAEDEMGRRLPSGTYMARLQVGSAVVVKKMLLAR